MNQVRHAILRRLQHFTARGDVEFRVSDSYIDEDIANDVAIDMGAIVTSQWDLPLPSCPDCQGDLIWAEAGLVPGARECTACGSRFSIDTEGA